MGEIIYDKPLGNFAVLKISIPSFIPIKYVNFLNYDKSSKFFPSVFYRDDGKWYIRMTFLSALPRNELEILAREISERYDEMGMGGNVIVSGDRSLLRTLDDRFSRFYNSIAAIPGTLIYPFVLIGEGEALVGLEFTDGAAPEVSNLLLEFIASSDGLVDIWLLGKSPAPPPSDFMSHHFFSFIGSTLLRIITRFLWRQIG